MQGFNTKTLPHHAVGHDQDQHALARVFESSRRAAAARVHYLDAQDMSITLWALTKTSTVLPRVCESLCQTAAAEVQDFNAQNSTFTLWAMTKTGMISPSLSMNV